MKNFCVCLHGNDLEYLEKGACYSNNNILSGKLTTMKPMPILKFGKEIYIYVKLAKNVLFKSCVYIHLKKGEWNNSEMKEVQNNFFKNENKFHNLKYFEDGKNYKTFEKRIIKYIKEEDEFKLEKFVFIGIENRLFDTQLLFTISNFFS